MPGKIAILLPLEMNLEQAIKTAIRDVPDFPKSGIVFKDITPIFTNQDLCDKIVDGFVSAMTETPDAIVGIDSRGFLFGMLLANRLRVPFVLARKEGKLPYKKRQVKYALEYGEAAIEMHEDALQPGMKVVIHDDLLATGGTAEAAAKLVEMAGAEVMAFQFVVGLEFLNGKEKINKHTTHITCLAQY